MEHLKTFESYFDNRATSATILSSDRITDFFKIKSKNFSDSFLSLSFDEFDEEFEIILYPDNNLELDKIKKHKSTTYYKATLDRNRRPPLLILNFENKKLLKIFK